MPVLNTIIFTNTIMIISLCINIFKPALTPNSIDPTSQRLRPPCSLLQLWAQNPNMMSICFPKIIKNANTFRSRPSLALRFLTQNILSPIVLFQSCRHIPLHVCHLILGGNQHREMSDSDIRGLRHTGVHWCSTKGKITRI